ncbi:hypothetical protein DFJ74DRAFT_711349 [Hyaloraphidium curvatum]|nr:hypothetical protein DFJ74DRAFT_711349 [Hyaloraphidium curvatum]
MDVDASGNPVFCGWFRGGEHTLGMAVTTDQAYCAKISGTTGAVLWVVSMGPSAIAADLKPAVDSSDDVVVALTAYSSVSFNSTTTVAGALAAGTSDWAGFIAKYSSSGSLLWAKKVTDSDNLRPLAIDTDSSGNVYVIGGVTGSFTFAGSTFSGLDFLGFEDCFLVKYSSLGAELWGRAYFNSSGTGVPCRGLAVTSTDVYIGGHLGDLSSFNFGSTRVRGPTLWFGRVSSSGTASKVVQVANIMSNPVGQSVDHATLRGSSLYFGGGIVGDPAVSSPTLSGVPVPVDAIFSDGFIFKFDTGLNVLTS